MGRLTRTDISMAINILCNPQSGDESDIRKAVADAIEAMRELQHYKDLEEQGRLISIHEVAMLLAEAFGDDCACNFNGNDEWLYKVCDFTDTCCPHPVGVACWEQYVKAKLKELKGE